MNTKHFIGLLFFCHVSWTATKAQNIRNDTIHISTGTLVEFKFPNAADKAELPDSDESYRLAGLGKKSLTITALKKEAKPQRLLITEGPRKHRFILMSAEKTPKLVVNWSNRKELEKYTKAKQEKAAQELEAADRLLKAGNLEAALAKYDWALLEVDEAKEALVQSKMEEAKKQSALQKQQQFKEAMARANRFETEKKYLEAFEAVQAALASLPGDPTALKKEADLRQLLFNDHISKARAKKKENDFVSAKVHYEQAREYDAAKFQAQKPEYESVVKNVNGQLYSDWIKKGENAQALKEWAAAKEAYAKALEVKPTDKKAAEKLKIVDRELVKWADARMKEAEYYALLSKAQNMAARAASEQELRAAIDEFKKATRLFPARQFPKTKISDLEKRKTTTSAKI